MSFPSIGKEKAMNRHEFYLVQFFNTNYPNYQHDFVVMVDNRTRSICHHSVNFFGGEAQLPKYTSNFRLELIKE